MNETHKPNRKAKVLEQLQDAYRRRINLGAEPQDVPAGMPDWGWVTGIHFVVHGGGTRYGARIHELRHEDGVEVLHFNEHRDGVVIPFYRLKSDPDTAASSKAEYSANEPPAPLAPPSLFGSETMEPATVGYGRD